MRAPRHGAGEENPLIRLKEFLWERENWEVLFTKAVVR